MPPKPDRTVVALCVAVSIIAGGTASILTVASGADLATAFLAGGGAFIVALQTAILVAEKLGML